MFLRKTKIAFTLVELVITITIVAILSTLSIVAYSSYSSSTRDEKRKLDIATIEKALHEYKKDKGKYPLPWNSFNITYSWSIVALQWELNLDVRLTTLKSIPVDPLSWKYYSYSTTRNAKQFQLASTLESSWKNKTFLSWDYKSVAKTILPNIILAISAAEWTNIEIGSWTIQGNTNRKRFLFNESETNVIYSFNWWWVPESNWDSFDNHLTQGETNDYWQQHSYKSCREIARVGKYLGEWYYQILQDNWHYITTWCSLSSSTCVAGEHLSWWICVSNTQSCLITNGTGTQTWNATWGVCNVVSCDIGYTLFSNSCVVFCSVGGIMPCIIP